MWTHKVAPDQLGSQVGIPFYTFNPCTAGRFKNFLSKWQTITSDQRILNANRGVTTDFNEQPTQFFYTQPVQFQSIGERSLINKLNAFLKGGSLRRPHTQLESTFLMFSYAQRWLSLPYSESQTTESISRISPFQNGES